MKLKVRNIPLIFFAGMFILYSCTGSEGRDGEPANTGMQHVEEEKIPVEVMTVEKQTFYRQIISNGKLRSRRKAGLAFETGGKISKIYVRNGDKVKKGETIASLGDFKLQNQFEQKKAQLQQAELQLHDILIGQGYQIADTAEIPGAALQAAKTRSGYSQALNAFELARYNVKAAVLRAPFSGIIVSLGAKAHNLVSQSEIVCTLIDNSQFEATFSVLEHELADVRTGQQVQIAPFAFDTLAFRGFVKEINPVVDENGQLQVKALVNNRKTLLYEGMNVKATIEISVPDMIIVPKEAIVVRSGKEVVFTYVDGLAKWNYVTTGYENATSYTISKGLKSGDTIIVRGNLNLGHDAEVEMNPHK